MAVSVFRGLPAFCIVVAHVALVAPISDAQEKGQDTALPASSDARMEALAKAAADRKKVIGLMLDVIKSRGDEFRPISSYAAGDSTWYAIEVLGRLRAPEAVEPLLDKIDTTYEQVVSLSRGIMDRQIIAILARIGKPASLAAADRLGSDKSAVRAKMYVRVIALVEGVELGKEMVRIASEKEKDPNKKARFKEALELFKDADKPIP